MKGKTVGQIHDDIKTLRVAGRFEEVKDILTKASEGHHLRSIRDDDRLSPDGKLQALAWDFQQRLNAASRKLNSLAAQVVIDDRDDAGRVFGTLGLSGDPASLSISRRDAGDRVARVETKAELQTLLRRATRYGDEILARACVERAVELRLPDVVNEFSAARPKLEAAVDRLWAADQAQHDTFEVGALLMGMRPPELMGKSGAAIEQLAQSEVAAVASNPFKPTTRLPHFVGPAYTPGADGV